MDKSEVMGINGLRLLLFVAATVVWIVIMKIATSPLSSETIIQFEFAGTGLAANNMIASLQGSGQLELMVRSILLDCLFPLLYGGTLICATIWICGKLPEGNILNRPNIFIAAVVIAIIADLFENICLLVMIYYTPGDALALLAYIAAAFKFLLIGISFTHFVLSGLVILLNKTERGTA